MKPPRSGGSRRATRRGRVRDAATVLMFAAALIITATAPAAADDCSGPEDCANVVHGSGLVATLLALLLGVSAARGIGKSREKGREWVRAHVRAVAGAAPHISVEVAPRVDGSLPTRVVRIDPHVDSGAQVVEEMTS